MLIGTYEPHGVVWSPLKTPDDFAMQLLPEDFERLAPYFEVGFRHFPALGRVGIRKAINGPFTFAPDGNPLVGPVRGLRNYWVACAVMAGFSQGGGIGLVLSRWMAEGDPGQDILSMDVARFGAFATPEVHLDQGAGELLAALPPRLSRTRNCRPRARCAARRSTSSLKAAGAVMGANFGLENALWFAPPGVAPTETPTYRRSEAFPFVRAECQAVRARRRPVRDHQLRQVRGSRARRARLARPGVCLPHPAAGPARARADAESGRTHRRRPVDGVPRGWIAS